MDGALPMLPTRNGHRLDRLCGVFVDPLRLSSFAGGNNLVVLKQEGRKPPRWDHRRHSRVLLGPEGRVRSILPASSPAVAAGHGSPSMPPLKALVDFWFDRSVTTLRGLPHRTVYGRSIPRERSPHGPRASL